jgi:hypothetical protein
MSQSDALMWNRGANLRSQAAQREEAHRKDQAALVTLSGVGKHIVAAKSRHHVPLDEPGVVASAIRDIV